jgi:phage terminase large subunit-like protein
MREHHRRRCPVLGLERAHCIEHAANPVLEWCIGNVVGHYDARGNVYPRKARPEQKINAAVALIMAIARCMAAQLKRSIYETLGLTFISLRG